MTVYVDSARNEYQRMIMCHMVADTAAELHEMALRIGMKRHWYQPLSFPHYDLSVSRRRLALENGAVLIGRRELAAFMKMIRSKPNWAKEWQ